MATAIVLVGCYYGYNASGGPVGVGTATAKSMVLNLVLVHMIGMLGTQVFWGANPRAPIGAMLSAVAERARALTGHAAHRARRHEDGVPSSTPATTRPTGVRRTRSSSSTCTSRSGATTCCAG